MRLDYALYALSIIFSVITILLVLMQILGTDQFLYTLALIALSAVFLFVGFFAKPKTSQPTATPATINLPIIQEAVVEEQAVTSPPEAVLEASEVPVAPEAVEVESPVMEATEAEEVIPTETAADIPVEAPESTSELLQIKGISKKRAIKLNALGIITIRDLAKASPSDLAKKLKVSAKIVEDWLMQVSLTQVSGIGEKRATQLKEIGIILVDDLAGASAEDLASKLKVSAKVTAKWVTNAQEIIKNKEAKEPAPEKQ
jgi:predicted flap endonuclease-1-like 5' DNA nuclease